MCFLAWAAPVFANGIGENGSWQFETTQDRVNKGAVVDLIERKKGGYYDSFKTTNYNTSYTYVDKQFNCTLSAASAGNTGNNSTSAATSSPTVNTSGNTNASTTGNTASNGTSQNGFPGVLSQNYGPGYPYNASLGNNQSNSGALNSSVSGSSTSANTGPISAGGGSTDQMLNSNQSNNGSQMASVTGSTACNGPLVGPVNSVVGPIN
ncbi:MAG TPA: hypothetical protein VHA82_00590 [Ramlibacter sp.]|uniref:hypothetical protein n=1 Tax=Ramlibacter sp. TaxID=1917967 RepID=UPI002C33B7D2|nr:hypothetical protein [Ramlibacter sp.]HVZ42277.1 hypothetical protein [Ramlibacter sp.]